MCWPMMAFPTVYSNSLDSTGTLPLRNMRKSFGLNLMRNQLETTGKSGWTLHVNKAYKSHME